MVAKSERTITVARLCCGMDLSYQYGKKARLLRRGKVAEVSLSVGRVEQLTTLVTTQDTRRPGCWENIYREEAS